MWHRFKQEFREIVLNAVQQAGGEGDLSTRHLLAGLLAERERPAAQILAGLGISAEAVQQGLEQISFQEGPVGGDAPTLTPQAREAIERAYGLAAEFDDDYIGGEHLLLAFAREPEESAAGRALSTLGITWKAVWRGLMSLQTWRTHVPEDVALPSLRIRRIARRLRGRIGGQNASSLA